MRAGRRRRGRVRLFGPVRAELTHSQAAPGRRDGSGRALDMLLIQAHLGVSENRGN